MDSHFVYIVKCSDGSLYTGYAKDVNARVEKHNRGKKTRYIQKSDVPVSLHCREMYETKSEALKREYEKLKTYTRQKKLRLIKER
ncbi:GIY-YIG nuclease family protein [Staphylococcus aureus]